MTDEHTPPTDAELFAISESVWHPDTRVRYREAGYADKRIEAFRALFDAGVAFEAGRASVTEQKPDHQKMLVEGEIEVCDTCTNSLGYPVAWDQAHPEPKPDPEVAHLSRDELAHAAWLAIFNRLFTETPLDAHQSRLAADFARDAILAAASADQPVQVPAAELEPDTDHSSSVDTREDEPWTRAKNMEWHDKPSEDQTDERSDFDWWWGNEPFVDPEPWVDNGGGRRHRFQEEMGLMRGHCPRTRAEYEADQEAGR